MNNRKSNQLDKLAQTSYENFIQGKPAKLCDTATYKIATYKKNTSTTLAITNTLSKIEIAEPFIHATEHALPALNPSPNLRAATIIKMCAIELDLRSSQLEFKLPKDLLKHVNKHTIHLTQHGLHALEPVINAMHCHHEAAHFGATPAEAAATTAIVTSSAFHASTQLNKRYFSLLPKAISFAGRFAQGFATATVTGSIVSPILHAGPEFYRLRKKHSPTKSAIASIAGGITSFAVGTTGLALVTASPATFVINPPLAYAQFAAGTALFANNNLAGDAATQTALTLCETLPDQYQETRNYLRKKLDITSPNNPSSIFRSEPSFFKCPVPTDSSSNPHQLSIKPLRRF